MDPGGIEAARLPAKSNAAGNATGQFNYLQPSNLRTDAYDAHIIRIDQVIGDRNRFFARYVRSNRHEVNGLAGYKAEASPFFNDWRINNGGSFDLTTTVTPTLVLSTRVGYNRHQFVIQQHSEGSDPTVVGFPSSLVAQMPRKFFPSMTMADFSPFGPQRNIGSEIAFSDTWSFSETASKVFGKHSIKFGPEMRVLRNNQDRPTSAFGLLGLQSWIHAEESAVFRRSFRQRLRILPAGQSRQWQRAGKCRGGLLEPLLCPVLPGRLARHFETYRESRTALGLRSAADRALQSAESRF